MAPYIVSLSLSCTAVAASFFAVWTVLSERRERQRAFAKFSAEIAELNTLIATIQEGTRPTSRALRRGLRLDQGSERAALGPILIEVPDLAPPSPDTIEVPPEFAERFGGIWDLAEAGGSAEAIARATGQPVGRIELILALRREPPDDSRD